MMHSGCLIHCRMRLESIPPNCKDSPLLTIRLAIFHGGHIPKGRRDVTEEDPIEVRSRAFELGHDNARVTLWSLMAASWKKSARFERFMRIEPYLFQFNTTRH